VVSEEGHGATFRIELPERQPNAPRVAKEDIATAHSSSAGLAKPSIEVVD
jgi:hypothetical protein